ncbi:MAG: DUF2817 domain-containing protein [Pedosphaera sp.]|nr:DUF2817 domain-containing protein [Pedosphaera sp.]
MPKNPPVERLGKNRGRYLGETIEIESVLDGIRRAAQIHGWSAESLSSDSGPNLLFLTRNPTAPILFRRQVYISAGIHGDEPAGPLAILSLLEQDIWPADTGLWIAPCLNPTGFRRNTRESADGIDLNRDYLQGRSTEVRSHLTWLRKLPAFDACFCLHEDWESAGFYLYELNPDSRPSLAPAIVDAVRSVCPIESAAMIDGREINAPGIIRPSIDPRLRPDWPEAFWLFQNRTRLSYTLESPSDFPLPVRVAALVNAIQAALTNGISPIDLSARASNPGSG